jgi:hypothetical protein
LPIEVVMQSDSSDSESIQYADKHSKQVDAFNLQSNGAIDLSDTFLMEYDSEGQEEQI